MTVLRVDGDRLWRSLMELAEIGATARGGVCRLTLSDEDRRARERFVAWARAAGLDAHVDAIGNIRCRRPGADPEAPSVAMGSHLDSQPSGGKFDGAYGVLAGLEVMRTLAEAGVRTRAPLEVISWTNEEGSRFVPVMMGSGVVAGVFPLAYCLAQRDLEGRTVGEELARIGYAGDAPMTPPGAYFEAHIEQGPVLEQTGDTIGVVVGALGQRWFDAVLTGQDAHAGPTPMHARRDALLAAARLVLEVNRIACEAPGYARGTVGQMLVRPNSRNVVPGEVGMSVEFRNDDEGRLDAMVAELAESIAGIERETGVAVRLQEVTRFAPCRFDAGMVEAVREAARAFGYRHRDIVSGAGHDAVYMARVAPSAMIFVPCAGGLSHNEAEWATPEDLAAGANVLLAAVLARAGVAQSEEVVR